MKSIYSKKGNLNLIVPAILALVLAASILVFGLIITEKLRDTATAGSAAYTAANKTVVGLGTFADFWSIIVLAVVIAVVVGLLLMVLSSRKVK
jgi:ABC-type branched-subunit amino acid transport system permease subunit